MFRTESEKDIIVFAKGIFCILLFFWGIGKVLKAKFLVDYIAKPYEFPLGIALMIISMGLLVLFAIKEKD